MFGLSQKQVEQKLASFQDPCLNTNYIVSKAIRKIEITVELLSVEIELGYPLAGIRADIEQALTTLLEPIAGDRKVRVQVSWNIKAQKPQKELPSLSNVKNVIAVASCKGGVGKSTTAVNLALALSAEGASVGILDADIYGPSQAMLLGVDNKTRPEPYDDKCWRPIRAHGIQAMSMAFLLEDNDAPMVWRGPMVSGALQQLITQTKWHDLDYLIIDMPPGTGDIQLTLSQKIPVTGSVIVTTPQDIALLDARKGIEMFRKVEIPVLGIVENMSVHICSQCGHSEPIFGQGGGAGIAEKYDTRLLGQLPLSMTIRERSDSGTPILVTDPDGEISQIYRSVARNLSAVLSQRAAAGTGAFPKITIDDN
jgi:ATP-binding protein involved in chromosome partitioning